MVMTAVMKSNRGRSRPELRDLIFRAAMQCFREKGYARSSVDEIVAAAGVAKGTFFNFFPTKLDVLKAYYAAIDAEIAARRACMEPGRPQQALRAYASAVEAILLREGPVMLEVLNLALSDPEMRRIDAESGGGDADDFALYLAGVRDLGRLDAGVDPVKAAAAIADLWSGAMRAWLTRPLEGSLAALFGERIDMLFTGLGRRS